jgi:hypothetical protein
MAKNLTVRLDDDLAVDAEALARAEGKSLNETVKLALSEAVERRRRDPKFKARVRKIIEADRELLAARKVNVEWSDPGEIGSGNGPTADRRREPGPRLLQGAHRDHIASAQ